MGGRAVSKHRISRSPSAKLEAAKPEKDKKAQKEEKKPEITEEDIHG